MKIVLLKNVAGIGSKYDIKEVSNGYALNSLIPKGLAQTATESVIKKAGQMKANDMTEKKVQEELLSKNLSSIGSVVVTIKGKANDQGHLFASIHKDVIIAALSQQAHVNMHADFIMLDKPIKTTGSHKVEVKVGDKNTQFVVEVEAE